MTEQTQPDPAEQGGPRYYTPTPSAAEGHPVRPPVPASRPYSPHTPAPPYGYRPQVPPAPPSIPPPPSEATRPPSRVEPVPGTPFGVAYPSVPPGTSGLAIGALVAGIASILVSLVVACFGLSGAQAGWGAWVAGAFAVLASVLGLGGVWLGLAALRQIRRARETPNQFRGRGLAIAGVSCGGAGFLITVLALVGVLLLQLG